jgi:excisionase family DNA binding protein
MDHHTFIWVETLGAATAQIRQPRNGDGNPSNRGGSVPEDRSRLVGRAQVAERLGVSEATVRRLARAGDLTEIRVSKRAVRIPEADVDRHISAHRITRDAGEGGTTA